MIKLFRKDVIFCIKTLALYGFLIALLYCPTMHYEQKYDENTVGEVSEVEGKEVIHVCTEGFKDGLYPYARVMNLIEQCRALESEFRSKVVDFDSGNDKNVAALKELLVKIEKLNERLKQEMTQFTSYVTAAKLQSQETDKLEYSCESGKCQYKVHDRDVLYSKGLAVSRDERSKRVMKYTRTVLRRNMAKVSFLENSLIALLDKVKREEEIALKKSINQAKDVGLPPK